MPDETRDALLSVARDIIDRRGYVGLSMKTAAAAAGITPEVARRYYENRDALLAAALKLPSDPMHAIPTLVAPGLEGMGERIVRYSLDILKDPQSREDLISLAKTGVTAGQATSGVQELLETAVVDRMAGIIGVPDARMRANLVTSYLIGIATTRYAMRLEPIASASEEDVVRMVAPVVQDLLDPRRPLPGAKPKPAKEAKDTKAAKAAQPAKESAADTPVPPRPDAWAPRSVPDFDPDPTASKIDAGAGSGSTRGAGSASGSHKPTSGSRSGSARSSTASSRSGSSRSPATGSRSSTGGTRRSGTTPVPPRPSTGSEPKPRHAAVPEPPSGEVPEAAREPDAETE